MASRERTDSELSDEAINNISNLNAAYRTLKSHGINKDGLRSLDDIKLRLRLHVKQSTDGGLQSISEIQNILNSDKNARMKLASIFDKAREVIDEIDKATSEVVATNVDNANWKEELEINSQKLKKKESTILVAGETSSGKSSLINLLIGEELLPTAVTSSTSCITIIRYGMVKKFKVYRDTPDPETGKTENEYVFQNGNYVQQLSKYVRDLERTTVWPYKMVEVFWPVPYLENGTCIVDSPGVGENEVMTRRVRNYYANAFAFIYVVNSSNAGGIQKDRLQKLMEEIYDLHRKNMGVFDPKSAIFVCNKWDLIESSQSDVVKRDTLEKLSKIWPGCSEDQIFYMSVRKALLHYKNGQYITDDYRSVLNALQALIPVSSKRMIDIYWSKLYFIFSKLVRCYRFKLNNMIRSEQDRERINAKLLETLAILQQEIVRGEIKEQLFEKIENETDRISQRLYQYLMSRDSFIFLCNWNATDLPTEIVDFKTTLLSLQEKIKRRLLERIADWERENREFQQLQDNIQEEFDNELGNIRQLLQTIERDMARTEFGDSVSSDDNLENESVADLDELGWTGKFVITITAPVWVPLAIVAGIISGIIALMIGSVLGLKSLAEKLALMREKSKYVSNPVGYMENLMEMLLTKLTENDVKEMVAKQQGADLKTNIDNLFERLPPLVKALAVLFSQEYAKSAITNEILDQTRKKLEGIVGIHNELATFQVIHLKRYDYSHQAIVDNEKSITVDKVGEGAAGVVLERRLKLSGKDKIIPIALKVFKDNDSTDLHDIIREAMILRDLDHKNIVKFYGSVYNPGEGRVEISLAFELCHSSLFKYLLENPHLIPCKYPDNEESRKRTFNDATLAYSCQLASAVFYIHQRGYIHRDLKMDNVLIGNDFRIRLCDVGITKELTEITGTVCGTILYMAPELLKGQDYDNKIDVYALANIFWELWYGENIVGNAEVAQGHMQRLLQSKQLPLTRVPAVYKPFADLIRKCWNEDPKERLSSEECYKQLLHLKW